VREGEGGKRCGGDGAVRDASRPAASDVGAGGDREADPRKEKKVGRKCSLSFILFSCREV
jgi:hypothetical protein